MMRETDRKEITIFQRNSHFTKEKATTTMSRTLKVALVGATGETGSSIINALLAHKDQFSLVALVRPTSLSKPSNKTLQSANVELRACDLTSPISTLTPLLTDIDILISAIGPMDQAAQIPLATAAKAAGIKRFIPCNFLPVIPPGGLHMLRDEKERINNHIKQLHLPYTIVDVGWWYQLCVPAVPSGKTDYAIGFSANEVAGDGSVVSGVTHLKDIGRYVARIIGDQRTLNRYVFVFNELWSQTQILDLWERKSGEKVARTSVSVEELQERIASAPDDETDMAKLMKKIPAQYMYSWGVRGDNTPEYAEYLGYLTGKQLYPDFVYTPFEEYVEEVLGGKAKTVYDEMKERRAAALKAAQETK